jgi:hypothetical protein
MTLRGFMAALLVVGAFVYVGAHIASQAAPELPPGVRSIDLDYENHLARIALDPQLYSGSDGACQAAGQIFHRIAVQGWTVYCHPGPNGYVPSARNPMTVEWTSVLVSGSPY